MINLIQPNPVKRPLEKKEPVIRHLPPEHVVTVYLNNKMLTSLMATPSNVKELVVGFLYSENIIDAAADIARITVNQDRRKSQVWVESNAREVDQKARIMTSGCGRGFTFLCPSDIEGLVPLDSNARLSAEELTGLARKMLDSAVLYERSGGIHSAAICNSGDILSFSEDIGRHNAVDKVIGDSLLNNIGLAGKIMLTTGRISSEMMLKAFRAGIPILGSLTSPTDLAVELGGKLGVTVTGYIRGNRVKIYTHPSRLLY
ncbi:MAG: formate dehydrogenase accessory sulfurtransferase FdhD [Planctomycetota bacterium]